MTTDTSLLPGEGRSCYCRRAAHVWGEIEKCVNAPTWAKLRRQRDALVKAAEAYYAFTRKPEPAGFNNAYNQEAIRVGAALRAALDAAKGGAR